MILNTLVLNTDEWEQISESAHLVVFNEKRPSTMNRIDLAILVEDENKKPLGYGTYRELDSESVYMQYGGCFPGTINTSFSWPVYSAAIDKLFSIGYLRANTLIENENIPMLKFAFKKGFRIIGIRTFKNKIYCELLLEPTSV